MSVLLDIFLIFIFASYTYAGYRRGFFLTLMNLLVYIFSVVLSIFYRYEFSMYLKAKGVGDYLTDKFITIFNIKDKLATSIDPSLVDPNLIKQAGGDSLKDLSTSQIQALLKSIPKEQFQQAQSKIPKETLDKLPKELLERVGVKSIEDLQHLDPIDLISTVLLNVAAQAILFIIIYIVLRTLVHFVNKVIEIPISSKINTALGLGFGALTGVFWVVILVLLSKYIIQISPEFKDIIENTVLTKGIRNIFS